MIDLNNILYLYDKVLLEWLSSLDFKHAVFGPDATPSNEVAVYFQRTNLVYAEDSPEEMHTIRRDQLPRIVLSRLDPKFDEERFKYGTFHDWSYTETEQSEEPGGESIDHIKRVRFEHPKPFKMPYQIDIWAVYRGHVNQIYQLLLYNMVPIKYLIAGLPNPMGNKYVRLNYDDISNNDEIEVPLEKRTEFRKEIDFDANIWLFNIIPEFIPLIEEAKIYIEDFNNNPLEFIDVK